MMALVMALVLTCTSGWNYDATVTWYGPGLWGNTTACGQKLTRKLVGVAHRTLACGTLVRLVKGQHSITLPVVDRGPWSKSLTFDFTRRACVLFAAPKRCHTFYGVAWRVVYP